jgi:flagellar secretion chaperone FliS
VYRDAYLESEILSASPVRLVELLYRGAIEAANKAREAVERGNIAERNRQITRAQAIVGELSISLDHQRGGTLSRELVEVYDYIYRKLVEANTEQRVDPLLEARKLLEVLLEAWTSISPEVALDNPAGQILAVNREGARVDSIG